MCKNTTNPLQLIRTRTSGRSSFPTRTLDVFSVVFVLQPRRCRRRRFLFTFLWKTHSHKLSRRVRECREKHPYLSVCVCVCAREEENFTFHSCSRPSGFWCEVGELGSRLHDVCSTRRRRRRWQSYDIDWALVNTQGKFDFSRAGFTAAPGCGILFQL